MILITRTLKKGPRIFVKPHETLCKGIDLSLGRIAGRRRQWLRVPRQSAGKINSMKDYLPGKPVACNYGLLSINHGLLWGMVANYFGLLGFSGMARARYCTVNSRHCGSIWHPNFRWRAFAGFVRRRGRGSDAATALCCLTCCDVASLVLLAGS